MQKIKMTLLVVPFLALLLACGCGEEEIKPEADLDLTFNITSGYPQHLGGEYIWTFDLTIRETYAVDVQLESMEWVFEDERRNLVRSVVETCDYIEDIWNMPNCVVMGGSSYKAEDLEVRNANPDEFFLTITVAGRDEFGHHCETSAEYHGLSD